MVRISKNRLRREPPSGYRAPHAAGFTIIEMIIVLVIAAVLTAAGAPAMGDFLHNMRLRAATNNVIQNMHFARSEAVKRNVRVILCRSGNPRAATPACGGSSYVWTTGYLLFASGDGNNTYTVGVDNLLRIGLPASDNVTVRTNSTSNRNLEFNADGTTNEGGGTARFAICDSRGGSRGRQINVPPVGRPKLTMGESASPINCTAPS